MSNEDSMRRTIEQHTRAMRKSVMQVRIGGAILVAALAGWMTWLHSQLATFDAESAATMLEVRARSEMPGAIDGLRQKVAAAAPDAIARVQERVLALPALAREKLEQQADAWLAENKTKLAANIAEHVHIDISHVPADIASNYPGVNERERLHLMLADFVRGYRDQLLALMAEPLEGCEGATKELEARLLHLARSEKLTDRERLQREIVATLIELAPRLDTSTACGGLPFDLASLAR